MKRVILKQFGEMRTGTNYLRYLFQQWTNTLILMHVLGDKHSPPVKVDAMRKSGRYEDSLQLVLDATWQHPAKSTYPQSEEQTRYMQSVAEEIVASIDQGQLKYLISIKHPFDWAAGILSYSGYYESAIRDRYSTNEWEKMLLAYCKRFNQNYHAWLGDSLPHKNRCLIPYEVLTANPARLMKRISTTMDFELRITSSGDIPIQVTPSGWDHHPASLLGRPFHKASSRNRLSSLQLEIIPPKAVLDVVRRLGKAVGAEGLVGGQIVDLASEGNPDTSIET
ncbi:MAG: hypothetical protein AAF206_24945, partial [Bacteroidota bacterium]